MEHGPPLVSLNPFEGEDEPVIRLTSGAQQKAAVVLTETIHEENIEEPSQKPTGGAPKKTAGKAPRKQADPKKKNRKTPGTGALKYTLKSLHIREARAAGYLYPDDPEKGRKNRFRPGHLALNEIRYFQIRTNLLI